MNRAEVLVSAKKNCYLKENALSVCHAYAKMDPNTRHTQRQAGKEEKASFNVDDQNQKSNSANNKMAVDKNGQQKGRQRKLPTMILQ